MTEEDVSEDEISYVEPDYEQGQTILLDIEDGPLEGTYETEIDHVAQEEIVVKTPRVNDLYLPVPDNQDLLLKHFNKGASFEAESTVTNRTESDDYPSLSIQKPEQLKRIQRRNFVRVPCSFDVTVYVLETPTGDPITGTIEAESVDISAGGIQLKSSEQVPEGSQIQLDFTLPINNCAMTDVFGEILREWEGDEDGLYHWAIEFSGLQENQRNDIIQYVYQRERQQED